MGINLVTIIKHASTRNPAERAIDIADSANYARAQGIGGMPIVENLDPEAIKHRRPSRMSGWKWQSLHDFFRDVVRACNQAAVIRSLEQRARPFSKQINIELADARDWEELEPRIRELACQHFGPSCEVQTALDWDIEGQISHDGHKADTEVNINDLTAEAEANPF